MTSSPAIGILTQTSSSTCAMATSSVAPPCSSWGAPCARTRGTRSSWIRAFRSLIRTVGSFGWPWGIFGSSSATSRFRYLGMLGSVAMFYAIILARGSFAQCSNRPDLIITWEPVTYECRPIYYKVYHSQNLTSWTHLRSSITTNCVIPRELDCQGPAHFFFVTAVTILDFGIEVESAIPEYIRIYP